MPRHIELHIGLEKTGSTAIQTYLADNRDGLRERGVLYPMSVGRIEHRGLPAYAMNEAKIDDVRVSLGVRSTAQVSEFRRKVAADLKREIDEFTGNRVVLSSEHCSSRLHSREELVRLRELLTFPDCSIRVHVYLRRQDDFFTSSYSTDIKSGATKRIDECRPETEHRRYDYLTLLRRWAEVFGHHNLHPSIFDRALFPDRDVVAHFAQAIGLQMSATDIRKQSVNESLDVFSLEFLRLLNLRAPRKDGYIDGSQRGDLVPLLARLGEGRPRLMLPLARRRSILDAYRESNAEVARTYFSREDGVLFAEPAEPGEAVLPSLDTAQAVEIARQLWEAKVKQVRTLRDKLARVREK